ncbi:MAG: serine/threonine-protein kinase [Minicystis sp.]
MSAPDPLHPGAILAGKYRVERVLGRGGMGVVVQAATIDGGQLRAIKLLTKAALKHPTAVERFLREARATSGLHSEHVVRVLDVGALESGAPYMAMELLQGADLATILKARGVLTSFEAARYVIQACHAIQEAHDNGVIHRDLKPQNLFLVRRADGSTSLKVLDFGLSKALAPPPGADELTVTNTVIGSPAYMSPEQIRSARSVDPRSDVWSLGVVLYLLVTGRLPFQSANASDMVALVVRGTPAPPSQLRPGLPHALDGVILRCLEKIRPAASRAWPSWPPRSRPSRRRARPRLHPMPGPRSRRAGVWGSSPSAWRPSSRWSSPCSP